MAIQEEYGSVIAASVRRVIGRYTGTNAFGAKAQITQVVDSSFGIAVPGADYRMQPGTFWFPMSVDSARRIKPHIGVALLVRPALDSTGIVVTESGERIAATIQDPLEIQRIRRRLNTDLLVAAAYDTRTGKIIFRTVYVP